MNRCRLLLVIDNRPLQSAAWVALQKARKRLEKNTQDLHRHEEADEPAFRAWVATTFPTLVSATRELAQQVDAKRRIIEDVQREAFFTGRSSGQIWREWEKNGGRPPEPPPDLDGADDEFPPKDATGPEEAAFDREMKNLFGEQGFKEMFGDEGMGEDEAFADEFTDAFDEIFGFEKARPKPARVEEEARAIYRRMVQHLHPDRGGAWTPERARVWEQTQAAWAARDADWLARLEAEWEAGVDLLGPTSAVGRLRLALVAIDAARRDVEKRLRLYRKNPSWRFTLRPPPDALARQLEHELRADENMLRRELADLEVMLAGWSRAGNRRRRRRSRRQSFGY